MDRPLLMGGALLVGGALYYLMQPGRSIESAVADFGALMGGSIKLSSAQQEMVDIIEAVFASRGLSWLVPAAVANAYAESRLDPKAAGDGGASIGLFQLHERYGGRGLSVAQRQDPATNTNRIIDEALAAGALTWRGSSHASLASLFAQKVERCKECGVFPGDSTAQLTYRADLVARLYSPELAASIP